MLAPVSFCILMDCSLYMPLQRKMEQRLLLMPSFQQPNITKDAAMHTLEYVQL